VRFGRNGRDPSDQSLHIL